MLIDNDDKSIEGLVNGYYAYGGDCDDDGGDDDDDGLVMMMTQISGCPNKILLFPECRITQLYV